MDISAIILTCDRPARCRDTVRHTAELLHGTASELIVVNNGTTPLSFPDTVADIPCRVLAMPANLGAEARNEGLREARGELALMLDDDAAIGKEQIPALLQGFRSHPQAGAMTFRIVNSQGQEEACLLPTIFHGCACGFRRDALRFIGGYPANYLYYGEEYDVAFRLYAAGFKTIFCRTGHVLHARDAGGRDLNRILHMLVRNNARLVATYFPLAACASALSDVFAYYRRVGQKENAGAGFRRGCRSALFSLVSGLLRRRPLPEPVFKEAVLIEPLNRMCEEIWARFNSPRVILCGVGKYPSLWIKVLRRHGIELSEFWDENTCWAGQTIRGVPVRTGEFVPMCKTSGDVAPAVLLGQNEIFLTGTGSLAENRRWAERLTAAGLGSQTLTLASSLLAFP
ncbi:MAG: glycosyltransferase [Lentisphaerae bacterium]|nr:glycosyltransferase [Lentisphaerota bacterium]